MTGKQFTLAYETNDQNCIWWAVRNGDITLWKEEVVDLLNELHEENQKCKEYNGKLYSNIMKQQREYIKQINELQQTMQDYEDNVSNWFIENWQLLSDKQKQTAHLELGIELEDLE